MTERYDDLRRPFDLDEVEEPAEPEPAPWDRPNYEAAGSPRVPAYAAEDMVEEEEVEEARAGAGQRAGAGARTRSGARGRGAAGGRPRPGDRAGAGA